jgi:hypothetical protein
MPTMTVPDWIWNEAIERLSCENPAPRLRDMLTEAWAKRYGGNGSNEPTKEVAKVAKQSNFADREDKGRIILATQHSICCVCGVLIENGDEFCWFTDREGFFGQAGLKRAECLSHHRKE